MANRAEFLRGRDEIRAFLWRKWSTELDHRLKKTLPPVQHQRPLRRHFRIRMARREE